MTTEETRDRIIDAAERLFSIHGYTGTSLRAITAEADVNIAAVHYHFGSKEALLHEVLSRIIGPANGERLTSLERAEGDAAPDPPTVEQILEAFIEPDLRLIRELGERGRIVTRFIGRTYAEPEALVQQMMSEQWGELGHRFHMALCRAVPEVPPKELSWRLSAVVALIASLFSQTPDLGLLDPDDLEGTVRRMVGFLAPGLRAPATKAVRRRKHR